MKGGAQEAVVDAQALDGGDGEFELFGEVAVGPSQPGIAGLPRVLTG
ncbi:hypothetical protein ABT236_38030 [Streptomyces sp. NPDC001523]